MPSEVSSVSQFIEMTSPISNFYRYSRSTLFQFILSEFFQAFGKVKLLGETIARPLDIEHLLQSLGQMVSSIGDMPSRSFLDRTVYTWHCNNGSLTRLAHYSALWEDPEHSSAGRALKMKSHQAWLLSLELQGVAIELQVKGSLKITKRDLAVVLKIVNKLKAAMAALAQLLSQMLAYFFRDENVIFFLLRHSEAINGIYGRQFLSLWLEHTFGTVDMATAFVQGRYAQRGFAQLLPLIAEKVDQLQAQVV
jgi:hypothetical protein